MKRCENCFAILGYGSDICPFCGMKTGSVRSDNKYLPAGTVIDGRYFIGSGLYHGGSAAVYKSYDSFSGRTVAVKEFLIGRLMTRNADNSLQPQKDEYADEIDFRRERFLREARIMSQIRFCRGVPEVFDCLYENGTVYTVTEWIEGKSLAGAIAEGLFVGDEDSVMAFAGPFLQIIQRIHDKGIIHRDLSPDNIILRAGNISDPFVIDYGESVSAGAADGEKVRILKAGYSSPEERMGKRISFGVDIWSAGAVIYTLLTGRKPNDYLTFCGLRRSGLNVGCNPKLKKALIRSMEPDPMNRFFSAAEFAETLGFTVNSAAVKRKSSAKKNPTEIKDADFSDRYIPQLSPGTAVGGRYVVSRSFEKIGSCYVYRAYDLMLGRNVSLTEFFPDYICRRERNGVRVGADYGMDYLFLSMMDMFEMEEEKIRSEYPDRGICPADKCFRENGTVYLVSDCIPEHADCTDMKPKTVIEKMGPVYKSLTGLHRNGGVHGNICLKNLRRREDGSLCLINPGLFFTKNMTPADAFSEFDVIGSRKLETTEMIKDLYDFAALIYRLLCGYPTDDYDEKIEKIRRGIDYSPVPVKIRCRSLPKEKSDLIMRALSLRENEEMILKDLFE